MNRFTILCGSLLTTLVIAGCGSVSAPDDVDLGPDSGLDDGDITAPTVLSVSPDNNAVGVDADAEIVVVFSEPMDQPGVEAAWLSSALPVDAVAFSWNAAGDTLTVTPNEPLALAEGVGVDPSVVNPLAFDVRIDNTATDLADNPLAGLDATFSTRRRLTVDLSPIQALTRTRRSDDVVFGQTAIQLTVGDTSSNLQTKTFVSFQIPKLPEGIDVENATLVGNQVSTINTPFVLGSLEAFHVNTAVIDGAAATDSLSEVGDFSNLGDAGTRRVLDVTSQLVDDLDNRVARGDRTQYRLEFPTATNSNGVADETRYSRSGFSMSVVYLVD